MEFGPLPREIVRMVVDKFLGQLNEQTQERDVRIEATDEVKDWLALKGYRPEFGAREMNRIIHQEIKIQLADTMLFGELKDGGVACLELIDRSPEEPLQLQTVSVVQAVLVLMLVQQSAAKIKVKKSSKP